ncbi:hypothetical protein MRB53_040464 [Persea americana]|nr:hypothetical protein MRB53_040464 [Persea americana]
MRDEDRAETLDQAHMSRAQASVAVPEMPGKEDNPEVEVSISQKMLSAVTGSILTSLLVTPLDVVRVRLQSQQPAGAPEFRGIPGSATLQAFRDLPPNLGVTACCREVFWVNNNAEFCVLEAGPATGAGAVDCAVEQTQRRTYNSTLDGLRKIARNEGFTTLWRGLSPTLAMAVPGNVVYFAGYDWLRTSPHSPISNIHETYSPLIAGSSARVLAALCVSPIELFRTRMQATRSSSTTGIVRETFDGVREMVSAKGYTSLWRGLSLTLWRDVPFSALYWWGYEATRNTLTDLREGGLIQRGPSSTALSMVRDRSASRRRQDHATTLVDSFVAGALAGAVSSLVTTPFDVGKTRQQVYHSEGDSAPKRPGPGDSKQALRPEQRSMPRFLWHIFQTEGMPGLFKGWTARCLKVAPACAIMISTYEIGKKMAQPRHGD